MAQSLREALIVSPFAEPPQGRSSRLTLKHFISLSTICSQWVVVHRQAPEELPMNQSNDLNLP